MADGPPQPPASLPGLQLRVNPLGAALYILESILTDITSPALNPFGSEGDGETDRDRGRAVDVSAATMTRMRTPFVSGDTDRGTADETGRQ